MLMMPALVYSAAKGSDQFGDDDSAFSLSRRQQGWDGSAGGAGGGDGGAAAAGDQDQHSRQNDMEEDHHNDHDPDPSTGVTDTANNFQLLDFSDVATDLSKLIISPPNGSPFSTPAPSKVESTIDNTTTLGAPATGNNVTEITSQTQTIAARKPSPGLAARLKALGFGSSKKPTPSQVAAFDQIGRLNEEQIRQLDQFHHSLSAAANPVIERRGRPWKGQLVRIPSKASLRSNKSSQSTRSTKSTKSTRNTHQDAESSPRQAVDIREPDKTPDFLPEIVTSEPLDMDTQKYRLPDHVNANGTKNTPDTRREHLERDSRRPPSPEMTPPLPPPKDSPPLPPQPQPPLPSFEPFDPDSYFNPLGLQRPGSIYTISRASFAHQLAQLTSLQLPDANSLSDKVAAIPTAQAAAKALIGAADQIRSWIFKASEVIGGLDGDDDVEWSAAGGREGLEEVESATTRFEGLIHIYVSAIEELQTRNDIGNVSTDDLIRAVTQMESITQEWTNIRNTLDSVRAQVEIAMEWEELWNVVLGEIQNELDELCRLVFEMEERRHKSAMAIANGDGVDINDLETIVEETPPSRVRATNRYSIPLVPGSPGSPAAPSISQDDSSLLALFARMQPLRASLDFLPMRLSVFEARADKTFPTACEELDMRRSHLDSLYKKLEKDAEALRRELGEDRWILVFRGAGRQAQKMIESVERSLVKLSEAADAGMHLTNQPTFLKKIESYEAKKTHYGPAIDRVLSIIDKGVKERLTVNGEILRLHAAMQMKWKDLKGMINEMDLTLDDLHADRRGTQLRDSISSMLSYDRSTVASGIETPQSSPPSSVIMSSLGIDTRTPVNKGSRRTSSSAGSHMPQPGLGRRTGSATSPHVPRKPVSRISTVGGYSTPGREGSSTPMGNRNVGSIPRPASNLGVYRPRWNGSTNTSGLEIEFKPLSLTTPSPYAKTTPTPVRAQSSLGGASRLPMRSPFRASSSSPMPPEVTTPSKTPASRMYFKDRLTSPGPYSQQALSRPPLTSLNPTAGGGVRRATLQPPSMGEALGMPPRPASSLASMLPQPRSKDAVSGRQSATGAGDVMSRYRVASTSSTGNKQTESKPPPRLRF